MEIHNLFEYVFIQKAFLAGSFIAVSCASLGMFLVLRKMSLIGDGLAHISFGAIALGIFFGIYPFWIALPIVILGSLLILKISERTRVYQDAAIGIVSAIGIASGVILASLANGFNVDLLSFLFGNILAISNIEVTLSITLSLLVLVILIFFFWDLFSTTFDEEYAKTTGVKTNLINRLLVVLTAVTILLSIKIVGVMLVSALLILPSVTALQLVKSFRLAIILATVCSLFSVLIGITLSFFLNLPTGATIVLVCATVFALANIYTKIT